MASTIILSDNGASSGSAGLKQQAGNDGVLILQTTTVGGTATNAVYVDTSQNVGVSLAPSAWGSSKAVQVNGGTSLWNYATTNSYFGNNYYYNGSNRVYYSTAAAGEYSIQGSAHLWYSAASGTAGSTFSWTQLMTVDKGKTLALEGTTSVTGTGITFPATQSASSDANTLDDYEEGTFTPLLQFGGGSTGMTYSSQWGYYTKVGRLVTVNIYFALTNKGSSTGTATIAGFPFSNINPGSFYPGGAFRLGNSSAGLSGACQFYMPPAGLYVVLEYLGTGTATALTQANFLNGTDLCFSFSYFTST